MWEQLDQAYSKGLRVQEDWMIRLGTITPNDVSRFINFDRDNSEWCYRAGDDSMFAKQAEGAAHIWNLLSEKKIALLADEVGMGKTLQALAVCALFWRVKPDARILVVAPREVVADNWQNEFLTFLANHFRKADDTVKTNIGGRPIHELIKCRNLPELIRRGEERCHHFFIAKTTSFSYLNNEFQDRDGKIKRSAFQQFFGPLRIRDIPEDDRERAQYLGRLLRDRLVSALCRDPEKNSSPFDLLIVDEAHYYRNKKDGSLRVNAATGFFGNEKSGRIADRVLLLTATPNHTALENIEAILSYFVETNALLEMKDGGALDFRDRAERLLYAVGLRRHRALAGKIKYQYRNENAVESDFSGSAASELFFALYQKRLVQELKQQGKTGKGNRKLFFGYLEGFESFTPSEEVSESEYDDERRESLDFAKNWDSEILHELSKAYSRCYGAPPSHPKYDKMIENILSVSKDYWQGETQKNLIFVRRIPSLREISKRIIDSYDRLFWKRIFSTWQTYFPRIDIKALENRIPSRREYYSSFTIGAKGFEEDDSDREEESAEGTEEEPDSDIPQSKVLDLFTVKKKGRGISAAYTHATSFRVRFVRDESLFSLFFQPALDYRTAPYQNIDGYESSDSRGSKSRIYYETSCGMARFGHAANRYSERQKVVLKDILYGEKISSGREKVLSDPADTLWSIMWKQLMAERNPILERIQEMSLFDREGLALYLRKGILYASASLIDLYCWFIRAQSKSRSGEGFDLYDRLLSIVREELPGSLLYRLWIEAADHYQIFREKILSISDDLELLENQRRLNVFNNMNPIYPYSGSTKNPSVIAAFNSPFFPEHLVATSVLQEGVNLQYFCKNVHHYGIAWTPGDNEQRAGRIDRMFGLVEKELKTNDDTSLNIYYPYIRNTIDENQVGEFVYKKHQAERLMDKCLQAESSKEVENREMLIDTWRSYLRVKDPNAKSDDPYGPRLENVYSTFEKYDKGKAISDLDDFVKKLQGTLSAVINKGQRGKRFGVYNLYEKARSSGLVCLMDPKLEEGRRQPVFVELNYSSALSGFDPSTVYYVTLKSPLSSYTEERKRKVADIARVYKLYRRRHPLVQLVFDSTSRRTSYFAIHMKVDLLLFRDSRGEKYLSEKELDLAVRQLVSFTDIVEQGVFDNQDLSDEVLRKSERDIYRFQTAEAAKAAGLSRGSKERIDPDRISGWKKVGEEVVTKRRSFAIKERKWRDPMERWSMNLAYPFVIFDPGSKDDSRCLMRLPYPSVDLQEREINLLDKWFEYAYRNEVSK
jgi:hypothetical protein